MKITLNRLNSHNTVRPFCELDAHTFRTLGDLFWSKEKLRNIPNKIMNIFKYELIIESRYQFTLANGNNENGELH